MANDKDISVVNVGAVAIGAQSLDSTVSASKPMVYGVAIGASNAKNKTGFALFGNGVSVSAPFGTFVSEVLKAKSTAVVWPELPGINESSQAIVASSKAAGLEIKQVSWNPNATDLVGPLTAAGAQTADVIQANTDPKGCVNLAKALESLKIDTPVVSEPLCLNPDVAKALGDTPKWTYGIASSLATDTTDPAVAAYLKVAEKYGLGTASGDNWIPVAFSQIMTTVQWMNKIGADAITPDAVDRAGQGVQGPAALGTADDPVRQVPGHAGRLQRPDEVLQLRGQGQADRRQRLAGLAVRIDRQEMPPRPRRRPSRHPERQTRSSS